jgi:hypothetical protein
MVRSRRTHVNDDRVGIHDRHVLWSQKAGFAERIVPHLERIVLGGADHHVVKQIDSDNLCGLPQLSRES